MQSSTTTSTPTSTVEEKDSVLLSKAKGSPLPNLTFSEDGYTPIPVGHRLHTDSIAVNLNETHPDEKIDIKALSGLVISISESFPSGAKPHVVFGWSMDRKGFYAGDPNSLYAVGEIPHENMAAGPRGLIFIIRIKIGKWKAIMLTNTAGLDQKSAASYNRGNRAYQKILERLSKTPKINWHYAKPVKVLVDDDLSHTASVLQMVVQQEEINLEDISDAFEMEGFVDSTGQIIPGCEDDLMEAILDEFGLESLVRSGDIESRHIEALRGSLDRVVSCVAKGSNFGTMVAFKTASAF